MDNEVRVKVVVDDANVDKGFQDVRTKSDKAGENIVNDANKRLRDSKGRFVAVGKELGDGVGGGLGDGLKKKAPEAATDFAGGFSKSFLSGIGPLGPQMVIGLAAAAPLLGATISAGVIGGAGLGGVLGGVLLASKDPRVAAAGKALGETLLGDLKKDARPFIEPVLEAIAMIEVKFKALGPIISDIFSKSSQFLKPLVAGVTGAMGSITEGIDALVRRGKPVMESIGKLISDVGDSVGQALEIISGGSEDAATALDDLSAVIQVVVLGIGYLIRGLTEVWGFISFLPHKVGDFERSLLGWNDTAEVTNQTATVMSAVQKQVGEVVLSTAEAAGKAGMNMQTFGEEMTAAASKGRGFYDSQTAVAEAIDNTRAALHKNGKSLDESTEKGRANRKELSNLAGQLLNNVDAQNKLGASSKDMSALANRNRETFINLAMQFGKTKKEAENLADQMGLLKSKKIDFQVNTHDAAGKLGAVRNALAGIRSKSVTLRVNVAGDEALHGHNAHGGLVGAAAAGGARNGMTMVGEYGPELVELPAGTRVHSNPDTQRLMSAGQRQDINVNLVAGRVAERGLVAEVMRVLRAEIADFYGGSVQNALGQPGAA